MKVVWTEWAVEQLAAIEAYVAGDNPSAAERLTDAIVERGESLHRMARRGRIVPELGRDDVREVRHGNYRIIYIVRAKTVEILSVLERHRLMRDEDVGSV